MTAGQRNQLASTAQTLLSEIQMNNTQALRSNVIPSLAANFDGIVNSLNHLQPLVQASAITVDELYLLDDSDGSATPAPADFFCGSPVVAISFPALPAGTYALAVVHATGVPHPQQISLILSKSADGRWVLGGMFDRPMTEGGHDGLWYWVAARKYAQTRSNWDAWFYYRIATNLLDPLDFLSSPNLEKLQREADQVRPTDLPGKSAMTFYAEGQLITVTAIDTSTELGGLDLDVHYTPDGTQAAQLRDPAAARGQVTAVMSTLLKMHPELQSAFHGIWVHADQGNASLFALELPMDQIASASAGRPVAPAYRVSP
ncbi:MAG TPA: hypothetical protein VMT38_00475 [Terracidiphilus sp.]|nr:hypothetical protein [Terracidiphilus sp.]